MPLPRSVSRSSGSLLQAAALGRRRFQRSSPAAAPASPARRAGAAAERQRRRSASASTNEDELLPLLWHLNASRLHLARHYPASRCQLALGAVVHALEAPGVAPVAHQRRGAAAREGGVRDLLSAAERESHVAFWGLLEHYTSSLCLLWAQAGLRERLAECSCAAPESNASSVGHHLAEVSGRIRDSVPSSSTSPTRRSSTRPTSRSTACSRRASRSRCARRSRALA